MIVIASIMVALIAVAGMLLLLVRSGRRRVTYEPWPQEGTRFRTQVPTEVDVRREWPMDSCEATLVVGVELVAHARPEGATAVICEPVVDSVAAGAQVFVGRAVPRDPYYLSINVERLRTCCKPI